MKKGERKKIITVPNNYYPRDRQLNILKASDKGVRFIDWVAHRRYGKDKTCFSILAKRMMERVGGYYYIFPEFNQGRKSLWDNLDNEGFRTLEHIPKELWASINNQQMKLTLKNGSYLQVVGSQDVNSLVGSNPVGIVFSEWSLQDPVVLGYLSPIIKNNKGWMIFNYTPRGANHAKSFHEEAIRKMNEGQSWFSQTDSARDTGLFTPEDLEATRQEYISLYGDDALFLQEYYCSFETPVQGAYYGSQMRLMVEEGRLGKVKHNPDLMVYTAWDLGVKDSTSIVFYQKPNDHRINVIDYYEIVGAGMEHFRDLLASKDYRYATHYLPHDADARIQGRVVETRADILRNLMPNDSFQIVDKENRISKQDGIQKLRSLFPMIWMDAEKCERLVLCLKEYKKTWSEVNRMWSDEPLHNWASNGADAMRYVAVSYTLPVVQQMVYTKEINLDPFY